MKTEAEIRAAVADFHAAFDRLPLPDRDRAHIAAHAGALAWALGAAAGDYRVMAESAAELLDGIRAALVRMGV